MKMHTILPFLLAAFAASAASASDPDELDDLLPLTLAQLMDVKVTISTNTAQRLSKAPSVVSVITAEDLRLTGTTNLMEILQSVPGVHIKQNLFGFKPLITFRGASGVNVLLMVNGAPVKDLVWSPGIFWKGLPANLIERIEVIRGPGSALFGSDAAAGVINVITKTAANSVHSEAGVRAGSFSTQSGWLHYATQANGLAINFTAHLDTTDGHDPFIARARSDTSGQASYGWKSEDIHWSVANGSWRLLADVTRHKDVAIGLTGAAVLDSQTRAHDSHTSVALLYNNEHYARDWGVSAELRYRDISYSSGNGFWEGLPTVTLNRLDSSERRINVEASMLYRGAKDHRVRFGGGYVVQDLYEAKQFFDGVLQTFDAPRKRSNSYLFLQDEWTLKDDLELTAGARYDRYSDFGGAFNPRLALVWQTSERLTTKLMYGQAFRAPSYLELYVSTAANPPNRNLRPEKSKTLELAFAYALSDDLKLGANLYRFDRRDVIAPHPPLSGGFVNYDRFVTRGIEFEALWQAGRNLRFSGNLSRMSNEGIDSALRDLSIPLTQVYLRSDWAFLPGWNWNVELNWFDRRPLPAGDPRAETGAYALANTTLRYQANRQWDLSASIRNLFDVRAYEYSSRTLWNNLPLPGRSVFVSARYRF